MFDLGTDRHRYSRPLGATCHERLATLIDKDVGPLERQARDIEEMDATPAVQGERA